MLLNTKRLKSMFMTAMRLTLLSVLILFLTSCSSTPIVQTKYVYQTIPQELLIIPELEKPEIKDERDIDAAYVHLHSHYWYLRENIVAIKKLVDNNSTKE